MIDVILHRYFVRGFLLCVSGERYLHMYVLDVARTMNNFQKHFSGAAHWGFTGQMLPLKLTFSEEWVLLSFYQISAQK